MPGSLLKFEKKLSVKIGGHRYPVVKIGNQLWTAENLDYKFDVDGSPIPIGGSDSPGTPAAWYYNNDEETYGIDGIYKLGLLYNGYSAEYLNTHNNLLPEGWHVPSSGELQILIDLFDGYDYAGTKLKAKDNSIRNGFPDGWNGTDDAKFSILPGGYAHESFGWNFEGLGSITYLWTSTVWSSGSGVRRGITTAAAIDHRANAYHRSYNGHYIRLVKNLT